MSSTSKRRLTQFQARFVHAIFIPRGLIEDEYEYEYE